MSPDISLALQVGIGFPLLTLALLGAIEGLRRIFGGPR